MKYIYTGILGCLAFSSTTYAGTLGDVTSPTPIIPFVSIEGSGSWPDLDSVTIESIHPSTVVNIPNYINKRVIPENVNPWGGRIAAGITKQYTDKINFIGEAGWNYFGDASYDSPSSVAGPVHLSGSLSGPDLLVGASYTYKRIQWFAEGGTLFQRILISSHTPNLNASISAAALGNDNGQGLDVTANMKVVINHVDFLPEIKVGGIYDWSEQVSISLAYMHAFGGSPSVTASFSDWTNSQDAYLFADLNLRNPSLNSVLLGLHYKFV